MNEILETRYRGADLALDISSPPAAVLRINGLVRNSAAAEGPKVTLRVHSTVQTDYEWHEFIEGFVTFDGERITARILANGQELTRAQYPDEETA